MMAKDVEPKKEEKPAQLEGEVDLSKHVGLASSFPSGHSALGNRQTFPKSGR